jgi:carbonic anhydrase
VEALRPVVQPLLDRPGNVTEQAVVANIRAQAAALATRSELIAEHLHAGELKIVGARYDLDDGRVSLIR